jgi:hypothetical protein
MPVLILQLTMNPYISYIPSVHHFKIPGPDNYSYLLMKPLSYEIGEISWSAQTLSACQTQLCLVERGIYLV